MSFDFVHELYHVTNIQYTEPTIHVYYTVALHTRKNTWLSICVNVEGVV